MRKENIQYPHFEEQELQRILESEDTEAVKKLIYQVVFQLAAAFQIPLTLRHLQEYVNRTLHLVDTSTPLPKARIHWLDSSVGKIIEQQSGVGFLTDKETQELELIVYVDKELENEQAHKLVECVYQIAFDYLHQHPFFLSEAEEIVHTGAMFGLMIGSAGYWLQELAQVPLSSQSPETIESYQLVFSLIILISLLSWVVLEMKKRNGIRKMNRITEVATTSVASPSQKT